jgi:hypothetical protein
MFVGLVAGHGQVCARPQDLHLDYETSAVTCPDRAAFWNEFWARSSYAPTLVAQQTAVTLRVRIIPEAGEYVGRVSIVDSTGAVVDRVVSAPTCAEVSAALALISSIALHDLPTPAPHSQAPAVPPKPSKTIEWSLGGSLGLHKGIGPNVTPTLGIAAGVHYPHRLGSPEARIELLTALRQSATVHSGSEQVGMAHFEWYAGRLSVCPLQLQVVTTTCGPCLVMEVGAMTGEGSSSLGQVSRTGWWLAPGALLNWSWRPKPFELRFAAGLLRPLVRDWFKFNPEPVVFRPPILGVVAQSELGWSFQ